jgi:signal transduction histidine kinase
LMQPQAQRVRVIMRSSPGPGMLPISADARSLRQMMFNLLSNSLKFTPAGGQVIVSTALNETRQAVLRVRDTGTGMSVKEVQAALDPARPWSSMPATNGGTGLGLPLTKALAEANRARFCLTSTPSAGTLVEIAFPTEPFSG